MKNNSEDNAGMLPRIKKGIVTFPRCVLTAMLSIIIIFGIIFYWYAFRPAHIRQQCSWVTIKASSAEEIQKAKDAEKKCTSPDNAKSAECIFQTPIYYTNQRRAADDYEYISCLRENGMDVSQLQNDQKLKNLQQTVADQQSQLDNQQQAQQTADQKAKIDNIIQGSIQQTQNDQKLSNLQQQVSDQQDQMDKQQKAIQAQQDYQDCLNLWKDSDGYTSSSNVEHCKLLYLP
jgi:hypothetical protein